MTALNRILFRDLWHMRSQALAIAVVMACGVATYVMSLSTLESLQQTRRTYYERYRFADVFTSLKRAPNALAPRLAQIPGVGQVQTRIVVDVTLDVAGLSEPAVGRIISLPHHGEPTLNRLHLRRGRQIDPTRRGEVLVSEAFADAHKLGPGDHVDAVINERLQQLNIVGVVLSPEYIFQIRGGEVLPDDKRFGVFWMSYDQLAPAYDLDGAFNNVTLRLMAGASQPEVIRQLDNLTRPYGGVGAYGRNDQVSHRYLSDEIKQLHNMGVIAPAIFLGVAAFLLNVVLGRIIQTQREQIAAIKAFGYTHVEVGVHYLKLALMIAGVGLVLGVIVGVWMGHNLAELYTQYYRFPVLQYRLNPGLIASVTLIATAAAAVGALGSVWRAAFLPPAEAMRPEPPSGYHATIVERLGLQRYVSAPARMVMRQIERRPWKAALSSLGIAMAVAVLVLGNFSVDALDYLMAFQFDTAQRQDMTVTFVEPTTGDAVYGVGHLPGVRHVEPFRAVPVRLRAGHYDRRVSIMGLVRSPDLFRLLDTHERVIELPPEGLVVSRKLADLLHVTPGQLVTVEVMEGQRPVRRVPVAALLEDFSGTNAYMRIDALQAFMHEGPTVSGAFITTDANRNDTLYRTLKRTPRVAGVTVKHAALESFRNTIAQNMLQMQFFNMLFACVIAIGVVYNTARVSLSERSRELATLRVLGFTRAEISSILLGELAIVTAVAIPVGLVIGYGLAALLAIGLDTEMYRIPLIIDRSTYGFAATTVIVASVISGLIVRRRLDRLDLIAALKSRE
ncbi:MAG: FtsX-like permease family protein [Phycisphaera sp.]|nr:FtsX-like permease family protein [Phycisphaera sp.]